MLSSWLRWCTCPPLYFRIELLENMPTPLVVEHPPWESAKDVVKGFRAAFCNKDTVITLAVPMGGMVVDKGGAHSRQSMGTVQLVAGLGSFIAPFLVGSIVVAAPTIGIELEADVSMLGWLTAAFFLTAAALLVPFGRVADVLGSKKVFFLGMVIYVISNAVCALSPGIIVLIIGRAMTGVGAAMVFGTSISLVSLVFPEVERGRAIGVNVTAMFGGFTIGLLVGGILTYYLSWRLVFVVAMVVAATAILLILTRVKGERELSREREYDLGGIALYTIAVVLSFFGLSEISSPVGQLVLVAGGTMIVVLVVYERRQVRPLITREMIKDSSFQLAIVTNIFFQAGAFAVPFLLSLYFQLVGGLDARTAAFILVIPQLLMTGLGVVSGRLTARFTNHIVAGMGAAINAAGVALLLIVDQGTPLIIPIVAMAMGGIGFGLFMPAVINWALTGVARQHYGTASALTETSRLAGMTFSNLVIVVVFSALLGTTVAGEESASAFVAALNVSVLVYLIIALITVGLIVHSTRRNKVANRKGRAQGADED